MKLLSKKFLIIIFFMFFIFLFFNINECFAISTDFLNGEYNQSDLNMGYCSWETTLYFLYQKGFITDDELSYPYMIYNSSGSGYYGIALSEKPAVYSSNLGCLFFEGNVRIIRLVCRFGDFYVDESSCYRGVAPSADTYKGNFSSILGNSVGYSLHNTSGYCRYSVNYDVYCDSGDIHFNKENSHYPPPEFVLPTPVVPEEEVFKIHLKDLNCGVWRNFTLQYPNYSNEKYLIYLDTFRRDYSNCTNEVEAVFKLIVFNNDSFISNEDFDNQIIVNPYYHFSNEIQKYVTRFCNNETNNLFLFNKEDSSIYVPFNALTYNVFESTLSYCSTSSNYSITQFNYVESVSQDYFDNNYDSIYGDKICSNSFFIGSNCNIISVYENTEVDVITKFVSREILDRIFYTIALGNNYRYSIAYDFNEVYNRNSSCYGSNYAFKNEFWSNYRDNHKHIVETDSEGNTVIIPETNYVDSGFVVSGSDNYIKDSNSNNLFDQNEDVIDFVPVVQTPTNTDTFLVETEEGEKVENTGDISSVDKDVIEKDNNKNDTSSWGVIDFLKGLFGSLGDLFTFLKQALIGILDFISNIGKTILSLFVPDSDFWGSFSSDMNSYLNEHLGLIFQPFEILGNILERYNNIEFVEPRLVIPEIKVPLTDYVLMESKEVNFSSVLEIEIIGYLHNIYLCCVDVYLLFLVLNRIKQLGEEVFNK